MWRLSIKEHFIPRLLFREIRSEVKMEKEDLLERFMEEILASLEATSTEDGSAKRFTTAI